MAMKIEFAKGCIIELHQSVRSPVWRVKTLTRFQASEGKSFSFVAVASPMKARASKLPSFANGFASGPAIMGGAKGLAAKPKLAKSGRFLAPFTSVAIFLFCAGSAAVAKDGDTNATEFANIDKPVLMSQSSQASVRIFSPDEAHPRVRFSATGLPVGLAINPQTGVIGGVFDREANRNNGTPFVVTVNMVVGNGASGASTITLYIENHPPLAVDDMLNLSKNPIQLNVLANDMDLDGDRLVLTDAGAMHGAVAFMADGLVIYAPNLGDVRSDTINYSISDGHGGVGVGKVKLVVK
jgi:hypothetical protein